VDFHYHFFETNPALHFDCPQTLGYRLDIPAGTAVRFEPGQKRTVTLVAYAGERKIYGFRGEVDSQTYQVRANGELLTCEPAEVLPMAQRYFLF